MAGIICRFGGEAAKALSYIAQNYRKRGYITTGKVAQHLFEEHVEHPVMSIFDYLRERGDINIESGKITMTESGIKTYDFLRKDRSKSPKET